MEKDSQTDTPKRRDPKLFVGRLAALSFSIGVVGVLMFRAGLGCSSPNATSEPNASGSASNAQKTGAAATLTASASASASQRFLGGSKAWGDGPIDEELVFGSGGLGSSGEVGKEGFGAGASASARKKK